LKIFYCDGAGDQTALLAGAIHLGHLTEERAPTGAEIGLIQELGRLKRDNWGIPSYRGLDQTGNEVYTLALGSDQNVGLQAICHLLNATAVPIQWKFYKIRNYYNPLTRLGNFCVHRLRLAAVGRFLIARGIHAGYFGLVAQVRQVKEWNLIGET
jgi:hypothetical protein